MGMSKWEKLKLQVYIHEPKQIVIETVECKEWDEIVACTYSFNDVNISLEDLMDSLSKAFKDKRILLLPKEYDIDFYGFKQVEE